MNAVIPIYSAHARLSPSGSKRWMSCPGSIVLEAPLPDTPSDASDNGTAAHIVAAEVLREGPGSSLMPTDWLMERVRVSDEGEEPRYVEFTEDLCNMTTDYVNAVRERSAGCELHVEKKLSFGEYLDDIADDQFGTIDAHWLAPILWHTEVGEPYEAFEIDICDLKTGYKWVDTSSPQLKIYALAVLALYELSHDIVQIRLMIFQPRHGGIREEVMTVADLRVFAETLKEGARQVEIATERYAPMYAAGEGGLWWRTYLNPNPNEEDCAFCKAMATCPSARGKLEASVGEAFEVIREDVTTDATAAANATIAAVALADGPVLGKMMSVTGFLEDWIKAVRAEVERRLMLGEPVEGFGLELGRQGARNWKDPDEAERMVRETFRIKADNAYTKKLKSPTQLEKLASVQKPTKKNPTPDKPVISLIQWGKLQNLIQRSDAVPSVRPISIIKVPYSPTKPDDSAFEVIDEDPLW